MIVSFMFTHKDAPRLPMSHLPRIEADVEFVPRIGEGIYLDQHVLMMAQNRIQDSYAENREFESSPFMEAEAGDMAVVTSVTHEILPHVIFVWLAIP